MRQPLKLALKKREGARSGKEHGARIGAALTATLAIPGREAYMSLKFLIGR